MGPLRWLRDTISQHWAIPRGGLHVFKGHGRWHFRRQCHCSLVIYLGVGWHTCLWPRASWDGRGAGSKETPRLRLGRSQASPLGIRVPLTPVCSEEGWNPECGSKSTTFSTVKSRLFLFMRDHVSWWNILLAGGEERSEVNSRVPFGSQCRQQPAAQGSAMTEFPVDCHLEQTRLLPSLRARCKYPEQARKL